MKSGLRAIDLMNHKVITATKNMTISEAAKLMNKYRVGGLPVCEGKKLVGLVTERDIMMKVIATEKHPSKILVNQIMSSPLRVTGEKFEDISLLARKMRDHDVSRIPIIEEDILIGIVTNKDIVRHAPDLIEILLEKMHIINQGHPSHPEAFGVCETCNSQGHLHFKKSNFICEDCL